MTRLALTFQSTKTTSTWSHFLSLHPVL